MSIVLGLCSVGMPYRCQNHCRSNGQTRDGITSKLAEEAAAMEARLVELKLSMMEEQARREAARWPNDDGRGSSSRASLFCSE